ncbi:MAG: carbohydrate kinase [Butyricicoccus sp.]|nr:carbohydrate kinase [Butyricicoccus sp.]
MTYDVTAIGELLIDFSAQGADADGYPTMKANPGGAPGNFLAALSAYGCKTAFLGKVGGDAFGRLLLGTVGAAGIETKGIAVDPEVFTTLAFVTFDAHGERSFSFARKPGADTRLTWEEIDKSIIDGSRVFHFGTLSLTDEPARTATRRAVAYAKEKGKLITCDPNLRKPLWRSGDEAREQILWSVKQADVVKISDEELEFLWGCTPEEGAGRLLGECGVKLAMVTLGPKGCLLKNAAARCEAQGPKVSPVDTTGAGDIFGGSAVYRLLRLGKAPEALDQEELEYIARFAATAASLSTEKYGGIPSIPDIETVTAHMRQN